MESRLNFLVYFILLDLAITLSFPCETYYSILFYRILLIALATLPEKVKTHRVRVLFLLLPVYS